jgi:Ca-activated chloride channel homolog
MDTRFVCAGAVVLGLATPVIAQPIAVDRLEATMLIGGGDEAARPALPLVEERLRVTIDGQHASTTLLQAYQHDNASPIEGQYRLRPGSGSRVEAFAYWNGEAKIIGEVFERQTAHRVYDNVTSRRRDPGLLEEDGEGAFRFKVFPIQPREKKRVELMWTRWLERRGKTVRYRAPVTRPDADIVIELAGPTKNIRSTSHRFHVERAPGGMRLRAEGRRSGGELVLEWEVDQPDWQPSAYVHPGRGEHDGWFALALATPEADRDVVAAKDVTIVIDRSGSMTGEPLEQAKAAAADMIRRLDVRDRVNVVAFDDEVDPMFETPRPLDEATRARAIRFVDRLREGGGTDIALALATAIKGQHGTEASREIAGRPRVIVFLTDGQSNAERALAAARSDTGDVRLFTLGLGKDVNRALLQRLAAEKRGRFVYIERTADIRPEIGRLASHIARPLLVDVSLEVEGAQAIRTYPRSLPDVFADDELVITGRLRGTGTARFTIRGRLAGKPVAFTRRVDLATAPTRPWVGKLWAQARVDHLLEEIALGNKSRELPQEVIDLALAYNFVTPFTAFLAIPESELGGERATVDAARERKRQILAKHADAAELARTHSGDSLAASPGPRIADAVGADLDEAAVRHAPGEVRRGRGCAGCASGGDGGLIVLGVALAVVIRRRRRTEAHL